MLKITQKSIYLNGKRQTIYINGYRRYFDKYEFVIRHKHLILSRSVNKTFDEKTKIDLIDIDKIDINLYDDIDSVHIDLNIDTFDCSNNKLKSIRIKAVNKIYCNNNLLTDLDFCPPNLQILDASNNDIEIIDLDGIDRLDISYNPVKKYRLKNIRFLECVSIGISEFDFPETLEYLDCGRNEISKIKGCPNLKTLRCPYNNIDNIDVSYMTELNMLVCHNNEINSYNFPPSLRKLNICENKITGRFDITGFTELDISENSISSLLGESSLKILRCHSNKISNINSNILKTVSTLVCYFNLIKKIDYNNIINLYCDNNPITSLFVSDNMENLSAIDVDLTGKIYIPKNINTLYITVGKKTYDKSSYWS